MNIKIIESISCSILFYCIRKTIINFQIIPFTWNYERNIVLLLSKWWYNKITMLIWKLEFMVCTLGSLSDAINNRYTLTKFVQLFRHQYKVKCERLPHKKSDWNYYYLHIKFTRLYPHKSSLLLLMCVLRMSNHWEIIIRIIIYSIIKIITCAIFNLNFF